jgi:hypothetical protein
MKHDADNLTTELAQTDEGQRIVVEPEYVKYLRGQGYPIKELQEVHTVPSESTDGAGHVVVKITTYAHPKGHPDLDLVADEIEIEICDCWSYRQNSNDVAESNVQPGGDCKHCRQIFKTQRAKEDANQTELIE